MESNEMGWNGMKWNGVGWDGMGWNWFRGKGTQGKRRNRRRVFMNSKNGNHEMEWEVPPTHFHAFCSEEWRL